MLISFYILFVDMVWISSLFFFFFLIEANLNKYEGRISTFFSYILVLWAGCWNAFVIYSVCCGGKYFMWNAKHKRVIIFEALSVQLLKKDYGAIKVFFTPRSLQLCCVKGNSRVCWHWEAAKAVIQEREQWEKLIWRVKSNEREVGREE